MASDRKRKEAQVNAHRRQMPRKQPLIFTREDDWEDNLPHLPVDTADQAGEREAEMVKRVTCEQSTFAAPSTMLTPPAELGKSREKLVSLQSDALLKAAKITELNNCLVISSNQRHSLQDDVTRFGTDVANFSTKVDTLETENAELKARRHCQRQVSTCRRSCANALRPCTAIPTPTNSASPLSVRKVESHEITRTFGCDCHGWG
jgi:hypothetical protein